MAFSVNVERWILESKYPRPSRPFDFSTYFEASWCLNFVLPRYSCFYPLSCEIFQKTNLNLANFCRLGTAIVVDSNFRETEVETKV